MKDKNKILESLSDFTICQMIIVLLAFRDYSAISIVSQCFAFFIILTTSKFKVNKSVFQYATNKILFILICFTGVLWSFNSENIISIVITLTLRFMTGITIITYVSSTKNFNKFIKFMILAAIILCIRMLLVVPINAWGSERIGNYLAHNSRNSYGNTGITYVLGVVGIYLVTSGNEIIKNNKKKYAIYAILTIFSLMSGSKKQVIILLITIIMLALLKSKSLMKTIKNIIIATIIIAVFGFAVLRIEALYNAIGVRVLAFLSFGGIETSVATDASTITRNYFLKDAWNVFKENPIVGIGIDGYRYVNAYQYYTWAENNFVELLADTGLIGFITYYYLHIKILVSLVKKIRHKKNKDIQSLIVFVCLIVIDFTMVSYSNSTLQLYFALLYATNNLNCKSDVERNINE